jgi:hypothetical protein
MAGKRTQKKRGSKKRKAIMTIPQLRKAFEHVETFVEIHCKKPEKELVKLFQEEWKKTFKKEIDTKEAEAYVAHALETIHQKHPKDRKHSGGAMALTGAPILQDTRPGLYISPGVNQGSYAQVPAYVDKGFWNPEIGRYYDPVPGQTHYPSATPYGLGSNKYTGGSQRNKTKRNKKQLNQSGGTILEAANQFLFRPTFSTQPPPNVLDNVTSSAMAKPLPQSPDPSQTRTHYLSNLTGAGGDKVLNPTATPIPTAAITNNSWIVN